VSLLRAFASNKRCGLSVAHALRAALIDRQIMKLNRRIK
jgi:hypothetical protein